MGYDCTLHVIDPVSIMRFETWFLDEHASFSGPYADADADRTRALDALDAGDGSAGRTVLATCLRYCSTEAPHLASRGFCLGLWSQLGLGPAKDLPAGTQNPLAMAHLLRDTSEALPGIDLFTGIDGPASLGHFIPRDQVTLVREHVEAVRDEVSAGWASGLEAVLRVLRVCEARGLAYWEATDLPVERAKAEWLEEDSPPTAAPLAAPGGLRSMQLFENASLLYAKNGIGIVGSSEQAAIVDGRGGAPVVTPLDKDLWVRKVRELPDGRLVAHVGPSPLGSGTMTLSPRLWAIDLATGSLADLPLPPGLREIGAFEVAGDSVVVFPETPAMYRRDTPPRYLDGTEIPLPPDRTPGDGTVLDLGGGSLLLTAGASAYRVTGTTVVLLPVALAFHDLGRPPQGLVVDDGVLVAAVYEGASRLVTITRDGRVTDVWPGLDVYPAQAARDGAVVLKQQDSPEGDLLKVYWSRTDELTSIPTSFTQQQRTAWSYAYDASTDELWVTCQGPAYNTTELVRIPWRVIAELPRRAR